MIENRKLYLIVVLLVVAPLIGMTSKEGNVELCQETESNNKENWELQKDEDGVKVYLRKMPEIKAREFRAVTILNCSLDGAVAALKDEEAAREWVQRLSVFKILKNVNEKEWYTYSEIDIPWPFDNRDLVTRNTIVQDTTTKIVTVSFVSVPKFIAEKDGLVRMQRSVGSWTFKPLTKGKIEATYQIFSEPVKVIIPPSIIVPVIVSGFHDSVKKLREIVERDKYKKASLSYIN